MITAGEHREEGAIWFRARHSVQHVIDKEVIELLRKLAVVTTVIGLMGLTVSLISPAASDSRYEERTIRLGEKYSDDADNFIDVGATGPSVGDYLVFGNDPLYNRALTKKRG